MHPAHELLVLIVIALHAVLPLGTWAMLADYRDAHARISVSYTHLTLPTKRIV